MLKWPRVRPEGLLRRGQATPVEGDRPELNLVASLYPPKPRVRNCDLQGVAPWVKYEKLELGVELVREEI